MIKIPITLKCKISKSCILSPISSAIQLYTKSSQVFDLHLMTFLSVFPKTIILLPLIYHKKYFKLECICEEVKPQVSHKIVE